MTQQAHPWLSAQEKRDLTLSKNPYVNVYGNFIHNCPKLEMTQM